MEIPHMTDTSTLHAACQSHHLLPSQPGGNAAVQPILAYLYSSVPTATFRDATTRPEQHSLPPMPQAQSEVHPR
jgi:hypothetical protein